MKSSMPGIWNVCKWIWLTIIIGIAVAFLATVLAGTPDTYVQSTFSRVIIRLFSLTLSGITSMVILSVFIILSLVSAFYVFKYGGNDKQKDLKEAKEEIKRLINGHESHLNQVSFSLNSIIDTYKNSLSQISSDANTLIVSHEKNLQQISADMQRYEKSLLITSDALQTLKEQVQLAYDYNLMGDIASHTKQITALDLHLRQLHQHITALDKSLENVQEQLAQEHLNKEAVEHSIAMLTKYIDEQRATHVTAINSTVSAQESQ